MYQIFLQKLNGRGRNTGYPVPPAQIPACATNALGSSLEYERQSGTLLDAHQPIQSTRFPGAVSGPRLSDRCSSWAKSFPPHPPPRAGSHCSVASSVLRLCPTSHLRSYLLLSLYFNKSTRCAHRVQMRPPRFRTKDFSTCMRSTTARGPMPYSPLTYDTILLSLQRKEISTSKFDPFRSSILSLWPPL